MAGYGQRHGLGPAFALLLVACLPALFGQGCPNLQGPVIIEPLGPGGNGDGDDADDGTVPSLVFDSPQQDVAAEVGDIIPISWTDEDADSNASIKLVIDPDLEYGNGNEIVILPLVNEDDDEFGDSFDLDTSTLTPSTTYRIIAILTDGDNPEVLVAAPGRILLYGRGLLPGNISPTLAVTTPTLSYSVAQGDTVDIEYCGQDPDDDGGTPAEAPDVILMLDLDNDPTNDLDLTGSDAEDVIDEVCGAGIFPTDIGGAIVLGCFEDDDCSLTGDVGAGDGTTDGDGTDGDETDGDGAAAAGTSTYTLDIDVALIPPQLSGNPYYIRGTMWDHVNPPVHSYAPGTITVSALASGVVDLASVGRQVTGTRFVGFNPGDRAGSTSTPLGDYDNDGADDFVLVARYGEPFERGNVGTAYLVYGMSGQRYGNQIQLNSIGTTYRGAMFAMTSTTGTDGIVSVSTIDDLDGDSIPELLFGLPYVEILYDHYDDSSSESCAVGPTPAGTDGWPNPLTNDDSNEMGAYDGTTVTALGELRIRENETCTNDLNPFVAEPINQGYVIYMLSSTPMEGNVLEVTWTGQKAENIRMDEGVVTGSGGTPNGARFRGGWFDEWDRSQSVRAYALIPDNRFGETVASMPDMSNGSLPAAKDNQPELLVSAPNSYRGRGAIQLIYGQEFSGFTDGAIKSIPEKIQFESGARGWNYPSRVEIIGAFVGDQLGGGSSAGDFNRDGSPDVVAGAPGADRNGITDAGVIYIFFGRLAFGDIELDVDNPPRVEIWGTFENDQFGERQTLVGDINQDGIQDIGFASQYVDGPGGVDAGFVGIVFGGQQLTGENVFTVDQVAGPQLPGVKIYGIQPGSHAGATFNNAGDFNGDGTDDMVIVAPDERRTINGIERRGVAYVIFGGPHLNNGEFNLSQVGTASLPGLVFVSPYAVDSADEAPIDWAGPTGDVNSDGFDDLLIGVSEADFVNPLEPTQRRVDAGEAYLIYGSNTSTNTTAQ